MLAMDPEHRFTALDCLADTFFDGLRDTEIEKMVQLHRGSTTNQHQSQARIRQESSKSRSSMKSNTVEGEAVMSNKNKTSYG